MNIKKHIGFIVLFLMLVVSSCQKQDLVTDAELFEGVEVSNKMTSASFLDEVGTINDDEDEDEDPDGDENRPRTSIDGSQGHNSK